MSELGEQNLNATDAGDGSVRSFPSTLEVQGVSTAHSVGIVKRLFTLRVIYRVC